MRNTWTLVAAIACTTAACSSGEGIDPVFVYPPVRANTPAGLATEAPLSQIANAGGDGGPHELPSFGEIVKARFYNDGPTDLLSLLRALDERMKSFDVRAKEQPHACLDGPGVATTFALPGGATFTAKLQCLDTHGDGSGWSAFGSDGDDFYLLEGQPRGMGAVYRVSRVTERVEGWMAVADEAHVDDMSQVIMHLVSDRDAGTLEIALAGSGVGFCGAHVKMDQDLIYVQGRPDGPPAPGEPPPAPGARTCAAPTAGCFSAEHLDVDRGADSALCASLAPDTFVLGALDASPDQGANVDSRALYTYFRTPPADVAAF